jgi:hypothetical protein
MEQIPDIEGNDPYNIKYDSQLMARRIMRQIVSDSPYPGDMEWEMWWQLHDLEEQNGLPDGITAHEVYQEYLRVWHGE